MGRWFPPHDMVGAIAPPLRWPESWVIVGGGLQGTYLCLSLIGRLSVPRNRVRVLDPHERPLEVWRKVSRASGMRYLRSPVVHHIGLSPYDLRDRIAATGRSGVLRQPYNRPPLDLFQAHAETLIREQQLEELFVRGRAVALRNGRGSSSGDRDRWTVVSEREPLRAEAVILAPGLAGQPAWPSWAAEARAKGLPITHVLSGTDNEGRSPGHHPIPEAGRIVVVGAGSTAVQVALSHAAAGTAEVTLLCRHAFREHLFDADPGWQGARRMEPFSAARLPTERRAAVDEARHRGSVPPEVAAELREAAASGAVRVVEAEACSAGQAPDGAVRLVLRPFHPTGGAELPPESLDCDRVLLATGFRKAPPAETLIRQTAERFGLPVGPLGYPVVDRWLRWAPGLFAAGPLAELELGPVARNIAGARRAADRLAHLAFDSSQDPC